MAALSPITSRGCHHCRHLAGLLSLWVERGSDMRTRGGQKMNEHRRMPSSLFEAGSLFADL